MAAGGKCQFLSGSVSEEEQGRRLFTTVLGPHGTAGSVSVKRLIVIDCSNSQIHFCGCECG